jgi:glutamate dehydrogenase/leucine dehydrogenase
MKLLLSKFENTRPHIVFEWKDKDTEAEGWIVINSLRGGAAAGATRMRKGIDKREVESMAKTMEVRLTISGPPVGGAYAGINFNPADPRKEGVLERWYAAIMPFLKYYYGTGSDITVDDLEEVTTMTEKLGVFHPMEGIFTGYYKSSEEKKMNQTRRLQEGLAKIIVDERYTPSVEKQYTMGHMCAGYGVAESVKHYYELWGGDLTKKRAVIQGWGNVGAATGFFLAQLGVKIVAIVSHEGGLINQHGFTLDEIKGLVVNRNGNKLVSKQMLPFFMVNQKIWELEFEIFVPAATSRLIIKDQVDRMISSKLEVFPCAAHTPFFDPEMFIGPIGLYADENFAMIPDFIANSGRARVCTNLMENEMALSDEEVFFDISRTIRDAMIKIHTLNPFKTGLAQASYELAFKQLV